MPMSHNFRTDDAISWRYSGEGFSGEIAFVSASSIAFSNDPLRMAFGMTDTGYRITEDGGQSFHVGRVAGYTEEDVKLQHSSHAIAIHPTDPDIIIASAGFRAGTSPTRLFRSEVHFPGRLRRPAGQPWRRARQAARGRASGTCKTNTIFLHWNRDTPTVVYANNARSLDSGATWQGYAAGFGGCRAVFPGDHDICYGLTRLNGTGAFRITSIER